MSCKEIDQLDLNLNDSVARECNGLIFKTSISDSKLLVVPPYLLTQSFNYNYIDKHLENYDIYNYLHFY